MDCLLKKGVKKDIVALKKVDNRDKLAGILFKSQLWITVETQVEINHLFFDTVWAYSNNSWKMMLR